MYVRNANKTTVAKITKEDCETWHKMYTEGEWKKNHVRHSRIAMETAVQLMCY